MENFANSFQFNNCELTNFDSSFVFNHPELKNSPDFFDEILKKDVFGEKLDLPESFRFQQPVRVDLHENFDQRECEKKEFPSEFRQQASKVETKFLFPVTRIIKICF